MKLTKQEIADKLNADQELLKRLSEIIEYDNGEGNIQKLAPDAFGYAHADLGPKTIVRFTCLSGIAFDEKVTVLNRLLSGLT